MTESSDWSLALLWDAILKRLDGPTRALVTTCQPLDFSGGVLTVAAPNDFTGQRVEQRLRERIESAAAEAGYPLRLVVTVDPSIYAPPARPPEAAPIVTPGGPPPVAFPPGPQPTNGGWGGARPRPNDSLNQKYTFDSFVIGPSNRFAHAAAIAVAEGAVEQGPGRAYNPLVIYGDSGLGKTHLLHAIGNYIATHSGQLLIRYVSTEELTNDFINAIAVNSMPEFRRTYREVDVLLIDDIQFLESKIGTQEEFFHTFNTLHNAGKQIVMTSDRPPKLLEALEPRLRSRFEWGLLVDIQPADLETRSAILRKKAAAERLEIPAEVLELIATKIQTNIRELEGALIRLTAFASLNGQKVTLEVAQIVLKDLIADGGAKPITAQMVKEETATYFTVRLDELNGPSRAGNVALARQVAMYICRDLTDLSLPKIGAEFDRDHTTVIHACRKVRALLTTDRGVLTAVTEITNKVHQRAQRA